MENGVWVRLQEQRHTSQPLEHWMDCKKSLKNVKPEVRRRRKGDFTFARRLRTLERAGAHRQIGTM